MIPLLFYLFQTHVNPCFYTSLSTEAGKSVKILRKGEDSVQIKDGDFISLLPDTYKFSVSLIKDRATNGEESETDVEAETQEIPDQNNQTKECVNGSSSNNGDGAERGNEKTLNLSDNEIAFYGSDVSEAEDVHGRDGAPSPSLLPISDPAGDEGPDAKRPRLNSPEGDGAESENEKMLNLSDNKIAFDGSDAPRAEGVHSRDGAALPSLLPVSDPAGDEGPNAKHPCPNSPEDVKPDLVALEVCDVLFYLLIYLLILV